MTNRLKLRNLELIPLAVLFFLTGCAGGSEADKVESGLGFVPNIERARYKNLKTDGVEITPVDLNGDGKPDQWKVSASGRVVRVERDLNFDGRVDAYLYTNDAGEVFEEEFDLDVDGVVDVINYYRQGVLTRKEMSVDFTGDITIIKYYDSKGKLTRVERDEDNNNRIDTWEYYQDEIKIRTGRDISGDGTPDVFEEAKRDE